MWSDIYEYGSVVPRRTYRRIIEEMIQNLRDHMPSLLDSE